MEIISLKNWKAKTSQEKLALRLIRILVKSGFPETYIVGGYVRDLLLKRKETGAIDLATEATPQQVSKIFRKQGFQVIPTGIKHGTVTVHHRTDDIEITTFRKEGKYIDWRRPKKVSFVTDPQTDSLRRDFTVNALYFDPLNKEIKDFQKGIKDLKQKRLRFVGSAEKRIKEDALRLLRAVRFVTVLGLRLASADLKALKKHARLIKKISPERIKQELDKIMLSPERARGVAMLFKLGLLAHIMPEVHELSRTPQSKNFHSEGDVLKHTILALSHLDANADLTTSYGLLFHDLGKKVTLKKIRRQGRVHTTFHGHQDAGVKLALKIMKRLRFSNAEISDITWYIKNHHVPYELSKMRKGKQMAWAMDRRFRNLLRLFRADSLASIPTDRKGRKLKPSLESYRYSLRVWKRAQKNKDLHKKLISGHDVMRILKLSEGPRVGEVLRKVREAQLAGRLKTKQDAIKFLKSV